jgi:hypothetical protein
MLATNRDFVAAVQFLESLLPAARATTSPST